MTAAVPTAADLEAFCDAWLEAWTGNRPEALLAFYAEDARYSDPARPHGLKGRAELRPYFVKLLGSNPEMVWTRERLWPIAGGFVVTWTARIPVGGDVVVERGADVVLLRDGRIAENEVYFDRSRWMAALAARKA